MSNSNERDELSSQVLLPLANNIINKMFLISAHYHDIVAGVTSNVLWEGAHGIGERLLEYAAKYDYERLKHIPVQEEFEHTRRQAIILVREMTAKHVVDTLENPTILQSFTSRLLLMESVVQQLAPYDQDRIIAQYHHIDYRIWKNML
jgi:hypothetical protein